jgi:hypothetical protein
MDSYGFLRIPKDSYGFLWIPMDSYGFLNIPVDLYGFLLYVISYINGTQWAVRKQFDSCGDPWMRFMDHMRTNNTGRCHAT